MDGLLDAASVSLAAPKHAITIVQTKSERFKFAPFLVFVHAMNRAEWDSHEE